MKINILVLGGLFFLSVGLVAAILTAIKDFPSGSVVGGGSIFGATLGSLLAVVVRILLIRSGTRRGRFSKRNR